MSVDTRGGICLKIEGVPYQTVDWNKIDPVAHGGESGERIIL